MNSSEHNVWTFSKRIHRTFLGLCCAILILGAGQAQAQKTIIYVPQFGAGAAGDLSLNSVTYIANVHDVATTEVTVEAFDEEGNPAPLLHRASNNDTHEKVVKAMFAGQTLIVSARSESGGVEVGWLRICSDQPIEVETIFSIDKGGDVITKANVSARPITRAAFIAHNGSGTSAGVALVNPPDSGADAVISLRSFKGESGLPASSDPLTITLMPGQKVVDFLDALAKKQDVVLPDFWGWVSIDISGPAVWGVALEQLENGVLTTRELFHLD